MHWGYNTSRYDFFIVTRISKSSVWFKQIASTIIDDEWGKKWGFQKHNSIPNYKVVDGKNVPIITGSEFEKKSMYQNMMVDNMLLKNTKELFNLGMARLKQMIIWIKEIK